MSKESLRAALLIAPAVLSFSLLPNFASASEASDGAAPFVPINTSFWNAWDHYWTTWMPDHPVYEMIELTAFEDPAYGVEPLIRIILSERAGRKKQIFYLNQHEAVERSRANAYFTPIKFRHWGQTDAPHGMEVKFSLNDGTPVVWTIEFDDRAGLDEYDHESTPSIHSVGSILLFATSKRRQSTYRDSVRFGEVDYAHQGPDDDGVPGIRSWYNEDYFSAVIPFGTLRYRLLDGMLHDSWNRQFEKIENDRNRWRSQDIGPRNHVELYGTDGGGFAGLSHFSFQRSLDILVTPPLAPIDQIRAGDRHAFAVGFEDENPLMIGDVTAVRVGADVVLEWAPRKPRWALDRRMWSIIESNESVQTLRTTGNIEDVVEVRSK